MAGLAWEANGLLPGFAMATLKAEIWLEIDRHSHEAFDAII